MRFYLFLLLLTPVRSFSQSIVVVDSASNASIRGLSVVSDRVIWASGSKGMVGRSIDSGKTWKWVQVKNFEKTDFRDIEAFNDAQAVIMGVGSPAYILRTIDGGENWRIVYENKLPGMFLDAMEFWNEQSGIVIGDPMEGRFFIARTFDGGNTWKPLPFAYCPEAAKGEACFAASGTNITKYRNDAASFVTGGLKSRIFIKEKQVTLPLAQGKESTGANSLGVKDEKHFIIVGGDFNLPDDTTGVCAISTNGGRSWSNPEKGPAGYRSCVSYLEKENWITCGLNGLDVSRDDGKTWENISGMPFHVCKKAKEGKAVFLAGPGGKIARFENN